MSSYIKQLRVQREGSALGVTSEFSVPGFGEVKGAMINATVLSGIPTTVQSFHKSSTGFYTPELQRCVAFSVDNSRGVSSGNWAQRGSDRTKAAIVIDRNGYNSRWEASPITDGIQLECTELVTDRPILFQVMLFGGDETECKLAAFNGNSIGATHEFGFKPRFILSCGIGDTSDTVKFDAAPYWSGGSSWEDSNGTGLRNSGICFQNSNNGTTRTSQRSCEVWDYAMSMPGIENTEAGVIKAKGQYTAQTATGATFVATNSGLGNFLALAVKVPDRCKMLTNHMFAQTVDPATVNSPIGYTGPAQGFYANWCNEAANVNNLNSGGGYNIIAGDAEGTYYQVGMQGRNSASTTVVRSWWDDTGITSYRIATTLAGTWGPPSYDADGFIRWSVLTTVNQNGWGWAMSWEGFDEPAQGLNNIFYGADAVPEISYNGVEVSSVYYGSTKIT